MTTFTVKAVKSAMTKTNKPYKRVDCVDETGAEFKGVPYWDNLPGYELIIPGATFNGLITSTMNARGYSDHKLSLGNMPKPAPVSNAFPVSPAQLRKEQGIDKAQDRKEVMFAKQSAAEIIAHHPAYKDLNNLNLPHQFMNLTRTILDFDPNTSLTAVAIDDIVSHKDAMNRAMAIDDSKEEDHW